MTIFDDFFSWLGTQLSSLWKDAEPAAVDAFKAFVTTFESEAISLVKSAAATGATGAEKFDSVKTALVGIVVKAGWDATETAIETLIQESVAAYKSSQGESLVTAPK